MADRITISKVWGFYTNLIQGTNYLVKTMIVAPGARLSLQYHNHRMEHWVVVSGTIEAKVGDKFDVVYPGNCVEVPVGAKHTIHNPGIIPAIIIEVQFGEVISEDDIVRLTESTKGR
jgi:mannose-6-phosphate isomerase-like protein (cupin superfamily)